MQLGVTGLKKTGFVCLLDLFGGRYEKGWCALVCVEHLHIIGLMVVVMSYCGKFMYREHDLILEIASFVFLVLFKDVGGRRVSPRFHLFVYDINQDNEEAG